MATWNVGPFDNDEAAEWCDRFQATDSAHRAEFVESTLADAASQSIEMTAEHSAEVIAAAATVLHAATGRLPAATPYAMVVLTETEGIDPTPRLIALAHTALEILMADDSAFRRHWAGDEEEELALESVERIRHALPVR